MHMFQMDKHEMVAQARQRNCGKNCQSLGTALIRVFLEPRFKKYDGFKCLKCSNRGAVYNRDFMVVLVEQFCLPI